MRRLMMVLAVVSLLMSALIAVVWVRSYWRGDRFIWGASDGQTYRFKGAEIGRGGIEIGLAWLPASGYPIGYQHDTTPTPRYPYGWTTGAQTDWQWGGFQFWAPELRVGRSYCVVVPCWFLFVLTLILPSVVMIRRRRRARAGFEVLPAPAAPTCGPSCPP